MCNLLPSHKQIESIKKLESKYGKEENFINFNPETFKYIKVNPIVIGMVIM